MGCWPLKARVMATADAVRWEGFSQPHRPHRDHTGFGPFLFSREQYDKALAGLLADLESAEAE
jgi:hypothetical protein